MAQCNVTPPTRHAARSAAVTHSRPCRSRIRDDLSPRRIGHPSSRSCQGTGKTAMPWPCPAASRVRLAAVPARVRHNWTVAPSTMSRYRSFRVDRPRPGLPSRPGRRECHREGSPANSQPVGRPRCGNGRGGTDDRLAGARCVDLVAIRHRPAGAAAARPRHHRDGLPRRADPERAGRNW